MYGQFLDVSKRMGDNPDIIQASGGNTSIKIRDKLIVKASGKNLSKSKEENIFIELKKDVSNQSNKYSLVDISTKLRPSIETKLHELMPFNVVLHSHPIDIMAYTMLPFAQEKTDELLKDFNWGWIEYSKPGVILAKKVEFCLKEKNCNILILENHGLVVGASTPLKAEELHRKILEKFKLERRNFNAKVTSGLHKLNKQLTYISLPVNNIINSLAIDQWSLELARKNPHCPDHAVFCGLSPLILAGLDHDWAELSRNNQYIIVEKQGVILFGEKTTYLEIMLRAQAEVFLRIPKGKEVKLLSKNDCNELVNWEAEKYRKSLI